MLGFDETQVSKRPFRSNLEQAKKIKVCSPGISGTRNQVKVGRPPRDMRQVTEGIFYIMRAGCPWRDLPGRFGPWETVYGRFRKWSTNGLMARMLKEVSKIHQGKLRFIDGSYIRVHQDGAPPVETSEDQGVGTSRGGRSTKIHALVDLKGRPIKLIITPGNLHDISAAPELVEGLEDVIIVADKGYDSAKFRLLIQESGNQSCVPKRKGAKYTAAFDKGQYRKRHRVENFFARIKRFRRIATRYEKTKSSFEELLLFACVIDWIR